MSLVTIEGSVLLPNGLGPSSGELLATLSLNTTRAGNKVLGSKRFAIPDGGDLANADPAVQLDANDGLTPSGTFYKFDYRLRDRKGNIHPAFEYVEVTGSGTQDIGALTVLGDAPSVGPVQSGPGSLTVGLAADKPDPEDAQWQWYVTIDGSGHFVSREFSTNLSGTWTWWDRMRAPGA